MIGTAGERLQELVGGETVYAALDAIDQGVERILTAPTEFQQRRELAQLRGVLLTLPSSGLGLEGALRHLIGVLREPILMADGCNAVAAGCALLTKRLPPDAGWPPLGAPPAGAIRLNAEAGPTTPSGLTREATEPMRPLEDPGAEAHEGKRHAFPSWRTWSYRRLGPR